MKNGVLEGDLWLRGSGDPQLVIEDLWLLVQRLRGAGVREIRGNLMLDRSAFEAAQHDPGAFDGEALRPYNAGPDALLLNYKAVSFHFIADPENKQARVYRIAGVGRHGRRRRPCAAPKAHATTGARGSVATSPIRCGRRFAVRIRFHAATRSGMSACSTSGQYAEAMFRSLWDSSGGVWRGRVREGSCAAGGKAAGAA